MVMVGMSEKVECETVTNGDGAVACLMMFFEDQVSRLIGFPSSRMSRAVSFSLSLHVRL